MVTLFFITSLTLGALATHEVKSQQKLNAPTPSTLLKANPSTATTDKSQHSQHHNISPLKTIQHTNSTVPNLGKTTTQTHK